jgi:hypothetical protein
MVLGNLIQLNSIGNEDRFLYGNPQTTHFKSVYKRASNFAINYSKVPFVGNIGADFGKEVTFNIPFKADLLGTIYFKLEFEDIKRTNDYTHVAGDEPDIPAAEVTFDTPSAIGVSARTLAHDATLTNKEPLYTSYVNGIGYNCIEYIKLYINGNLIQTLDSKLIYLLNEVSNDYTKKQTFYNMNNFETNDFEITPIPLRKNVHSTLVVPFFFSKHESVALPLCALNHSDIQIVVKFKEFNKCIIQEYNYSGTKSYGIDGDGNSPSAKVIGQYKQFTEDVTGSIKSFEVYSENFYLDDSEKKMFLNRELTYLIELNHIGNQQIIKNPTKDVIYTMDLECKNPTKYILWYLQREDVYNANYYDNTTTQFPLKHFGTYDTTNNDHLLENAIISLNNNDITDSLDATFLSDVQLHQKFNTSTEGIIYAFSFALYPRNIEPSGTINFSRILHKSLKLSLVDPTLFKNKLGSNVTDTDLPSLLPSAYLGAAVDTPNIIFKYYTSFYNILVIKDGLGGLMYQ